MRTTTTTTTTTISKFAAFAYMSFRHLSVMDLIFFFGFDLLLLLLLLFVKREGEERGKEKKTVKSNQTNLLFASREGVEDVQPIVVLFRSVLFPPSKRKKDERVGR